MANKEDVISLIDDLVAQKTFSLDALDAIKNLRDQVNILITEINAAKLAHENTKREFKICLDNADALIKIKNEQQTLIAELQSGELQAKRAIYNAEKHEAVAEAYKDAFYTVFKPNSVRESIQRSVAIPVSGSPGGGGWVSNHQESEVKETSQY